MHADACIVAAEILAVTSYVSHQFMHKEREVSLELTKTPQLSKLIVVRGRGGIWGTGEVAIKPQFRLHALGSKTPKELYSDEAVPPLKVKPEAG